MNGMAANTNTFSSANAAVGIGGLDSTRKSRLIFRTDSPDVWLGSESVKTDMPANSFNLKAGKEYELFLPRAYSGGASPSINLATTSAANVTVTWLQIFED